MSFGGFGTGAGATPSMGTGAGAPPPASNGRGFGGFGTSGSATATTATTGGFGTTPASTGGLGAAAATGFGTAPAFAGGFGTTPASTGGLGAAAATGFGTAPASAGGFGTGGGFSSTATSGFGVGRGGGFGMTSGFGSVSAPAALAAPTAQLYPYPGIKGPGYATSWGRDIDFSRVTEQVRFETLPQPLQQHLMELRSFMHAERDAAKKVYLYFNESDDADSAAGAAATSIAGSSSVTAPSSSYRQLLTQMAALKGDGNHAVELVAVHCNQHEEQAGRQLQRLEKLESNIRDYERHVWEPLLERGLPSLLADSGRSSRGCAYRPAVSNGAASPFVALVEELSRRMDYVSSALAELKATLVPPGRRLHGAGVSGGHGHHSSSVIPNDAIAQINAALVYEFNQLRDSSCVAAHLHSRANVARELFTRQYGQAEADVLFADTEQQRNGVALFRRASSSAYFDIPSIPQQPPAVASAANTTMGGAAPTTGLGGSATSALGGGFGMASGGAVFGAASTAGTTGAATAGGFGAPATAAVAPAGGGAGGGFSFGAAAPAATGFGAAPAAGGFGTASAPAATGAPPSAPAMGPAVAGGAPTAFNLGGGAAATGAGFGMAPGKSGTGGSDDRPSRRAR
ncbi:hypothetical protein LSCM1_04368 [Leishmania martiniquensis]|uniref:Uncharacterized protein n=1 Tax=Leishmania martiniquensis TaxID=1580590 RepID=A0A836KPU3_9TRYP|nr:hypothetical protein LSCM1_04368 [Leishmania martiniquensis]